MTTKPGNMRIAALRRFATAITILNIAGHTLLGFEQSWTQPLMALALAYCLEMLLECLSSWSSGRQARFRGGVGALIDFLLPAHITALAVTMLLYANDRFIPILFATAVAIGSKTIFRIDLGGTSRHFLNPSNFGIAVTLILFPWVGIAPPYHFTENISGWQDWFLPALIILSGSFLNIRYTKKVPLILGWLGGFAIQALLRSFLFETQFISSLLPMTGVAFLLFTFYMISDPGTTPWHPKHQFIFGMTVAAAYGVLMVFHIVFGMFFALAAVCVCRGSGLYLKPRVSIMVRRAQPAFQ